MKNLISILFFIVLLIAVKPALAQGYHTNSNKALRLYKEGTSAFEFFDFASAENSLTEAVSIDNNFLEAHIMLGEMYYKIRNFSEAVSHYRKAVKIDSLFYKPVFFSLANAEIMSGDYTDALVHYNVYLAQSGMSEKNRIIALKNARNCEFAVKAIKEPVQFNPVSLGSSINTANDEYWPTITADGQTLMFTRQQNMRDNQGAAMIPNEDFYLSYRSDSSWQKAFNAGPPLNTPGNEGAQTLSSDGIYMYFTGCDRPGGTGNCDLYYSYLSNGRWSDPVNLGPPVNSAYWESTPSVSADGRILFFASSRPGGFGGKDIWYAKMNDNKQWSIPVNLGKTINSPGDELSPFIHFDGKTLYFASDGRIGMGGFDIFYSRMKDDSTWSEAQNLGYPINTCSDEMGLIIESGGKRAYFSAIRDNTNGKDIFYFDLYENARPNPVSYLKGKVYDKETGKLLKAEYELINLSTNKVSMKSATDEYGNFLICLPSGFNYGINVSKPGYLFYSETFLFEGVHPVQEPLIKRIILNRIKVGEKMQLSNVFYEVDSWQLKKESITELDNLLLLLSENKALRMEIGGYTDSTGSDQYNLGLSEKRALSVVNYLIGKGISSDRLKYKGYGNTSPKGDNITAEGRRLNRRTEAKVLEPEK